MRKFLITLLLLPVLAWSQQKANYNLAARFAPKKLDKMIFSLAVDPHWLKQSNKFWYTYETSEGKQWMIVDPTKLEKKPMFDRDKLAAELTKIVKDPFDGQHLPIDSLKFIKDRTISGCFDVIGQDGKLIVVSGDGVYQFAVDAIGDLTLQSKISVE